MKALQGVEPGHVKKLATLATEVKFAKDQIIYREGDLGDTLYFIEDGQVVIEINMPDMSEPVTMYSVGPGELFGCSALLAPRRKQLRARAVGPTQIIAINATRLRERFLADQGLENSIIRCVIQVMSDRMSITRQNLASMVKSGAVA
jgi:CRP/FNR family transcriptional regulator